MEPTPRPARLARLACPLLIGALLGCGVEATQQSGDHTVFRNLRTDLVETGPSEPAVDAADWSWPEGEHPHVLLEIADLGTIEIELYPELAPKTVAHFQQLVRTGAYDGTTFHRVIPGFMIQGGDALSRNDDPRDDGTGDPGYTIEDEFSRAPHVRGAVSMANRGSPNTAADQFFIVHQDSQHLDGRYTLFGRVVSGMEHVDAIARVERDVGGRWGPKDRPIEPVALARARVAAPGTADSVAGAPDAPSEPAPPAAPAP